VVGGIPASTRSETQRSGGAFEGAGARTNIDFLGHFSLDYLVLPQETKDQIMLVPLVVGLRVPETNGRTRARCSGRRTSCQLGVILADRPDFPGG